MFARSAARHLKAGWSITVTKVESFGAYFAAIATRASDSCKTVLKFLSRPLVTFARTALRAKWVIVEIAGAALIVHGIWLWFPPAAWIVAGAALVYLGVVRD